MMASSSELTLDCKPQNSYSMLLKSFGGDQIGAINDQTQTQKLEDFLSRLEEERLKIDAFKRELPLCMQLLNNAMETFRQQLQTYRASQGGQRPVLEEFIPIKVQSSSECTEKTSNMSDSKANWMTSAQLWSQTNDKTKQQQTITTASPKETPDIGFLVSPKLGLDAKQRNGGAFLPFSKERNSCPAGTTRGLPELALASLDHKESEDKKCLEIKDIGMSNCSRVENPTLTTGMIIEQGKAAGVHEDSQTISTNNGITTTTSQTHRKARRCWSPDLHRRFVSALQILGGSQVATPKQIRELMKVDGLTNDEVKSHLQKYRLHTRRPSPSPQSTGTGAPQLVVLGGIWVPSEYAAAHHGGAPSLYGAHPGHVNSPHYPVPQDYYSAVAPQAQGHHQLHNHTLHQQLHMYKQPSSQTQSSPHSDIRGNTNDQSESIEDGKSENSTSWKADSEGAAENGREEKGLVLREDGEESNESDITLKF